VATISMIPFRHHQVVERQHIGGGTAISGGGTPDTGGGTPFRLNLTTGADYLVISDCC